MKGPTIQINNITQTSPPDIMQVVSNLQSDIDTLKNKSAGAKSDGGLVEEFKSKIQKLNDRCTYLEKMAATSKQNEQAVNKSKNQIEVLELIHSAVTPAVNRIEQLQSKFVEVGKQIETVKHKHNELQEEFHH